METVLRSLAEKVAVSHTALLVIDMQNYFCAEPASGTGFSTSATGRMIPRLLSFMSVARSRRVTLVHVRLVMTGQDFSGPIRELGLRHRGQEPRYCLAGKTEADFASGFQPLPGELVVEKKRYSAFYETGLEDKLREHGIRTLIVTGVATNVCVDTTSRDAFMRGFYVVIPGDLVAAGDEKRHACSLDNLDRYFATVTTAEGILESWGAKPG